MPIFDAISSKDFWISLVRFLVDFSARSMSVSKLPVCARSETTILFAIVIPLKSQVLAWFLCQPCSNLLATQVVAAIAGIHQYRPRP
jgi:hypothetical protein